MRAKPMHNVLFILNGFGVVGALLVILISLSWGLGDILHIDLMRYPFSSSDDSTVLSWDVFSYISFYFVLFYLALFCSLSYLKTFSIFLPHTILNSIKTSVVVLCFLYYLVSVLRLGADDYFGLFKVSSGFMTPLWMISSLVLFNGLTKKILLISYVFILLEMVMFGFIYFDETIRFNRRIFPVACLLSLSILATFPLFLKWLNGSASLFVIHKWIFFALLPFLSIFGVMVMILYYVFF